LPILEKYDVKNVAVHCSKQLYKGGVQSKSKSVLQRRYYNNKFKEMQERFPAIDHWMIGRGLIADPFPTSMIKMIH
jgi:hypothetical protein